MTDSEWEELGSALRHIQQGDFAETNEGWSEIGYALLSIKDTRPAAQLWLDFSKQAANYEPGQPESWWSAHVNQVPRSDFRHIFSIARANGWGKTVPAEAFGLVESGGNPAPVTVGRLPVVDDKGQVCTVDPMPPKPARETIRIEGGNLPLCIEWCTTLMKDELYHNGGQLLRVEDTTMRPMPAGLLAERLTQLAKWQKFDARAKGWVDINCPDDIADKFVKRSIWDLRQLEAIVTAPFIRPDGSICDEPGYDAATHAIYSPNATFPAILSEPTEADARRALDVLLSPFDEFPYQDEYARSAFAAHLLTEATRLSVDCSPMFWYTAADPGAGKSMLTDMPSTIVHGKRPPRRPWLRSEDELRKTLMSSMLAGNRNMIFDNMPNGFKARAAELCAVITATEWQDRKLGVSESPIVRNRMVISASGNNVTPVADMARRSLVIRLVAPNGADAGREYKIPDLREYVNEHRPELLVAALTIVRAYRLHGATRKYPAPLPTFEQWSKRVRNPMLWLGLPDPVETQKETDPETAGLGAVFRILGPMFAGSEISAPDIARAAGNHDKLNDALVAAGCDEPYSPRKVGYWLRENRDRRGGTWKLIHGQKTEDGRTWAIVSTQTNEDLA
jgi:putative DNA primase/helicase